jgi:hypothetical protein
MNIIDDEISFEIRDSGDFIRLVPAALMSPHAENDWDRNWIKTKIFVKAGVFSAQYPAEFVTTEFESLKQQLRRLDTDFNGTATFESMEGHLTLRIKGDGLGHFKVNCEAAPEPGQGPTLSFSISFDQTQIKDYVNQLTKITKKFPISGNLQIKNK